MIDDYKSPKRRTQRETYASVRNLDFKVYSDICAFASTIDITQESHRVRAAIEYFCMDLARRVDTLKESQIDLFEADDE